MQEIIDLLYNGNYSCVIKNDEVTRVFKQRGVADLYDLIKNEPEFLSGASIADKVIGKAAASLMLLGGIKEIYADMISEPAIDLLTKNNIEVSFKNKVSYIKNRDQSGWCPLEELTNGEESLDNIFSLIEVFILKMRANMK